MGKDSEKNLRRLKTNLNISDGELIAHPGILMATQADGEESGNPEGKILIFPLNGYYKKFRYDFKTDKFVEDKIITDEKYLQKMIANTQLMWSDGFPAYKNHCQHGAAWGWFDPRTMELTDSGLWITPDWNPDTAKEIADGKWRYTSSGWADDYYDPMLNKRIGPLLGEVSLTNSPYFTRQHGLAADNEQEIVAAIQVDAAYFDNHSTEEHSMDKKTKVQLGLPEDASDKEGQAALATMKASAEENTAVRESLGIEDDEKADEAVLKLVKDADAGKDPDADKDPDAAGKSDPVVGQGMGADIAEMCVTDMIEGGYDIAPKSPDVALMKTHVAEMDTATFKAFRSLIPKKAKQTSLKKEAAEGNVADKLSEVPDDAFTAAGYDRNNMPKGKGAK